MVQPARTEGNLERFDTRLEGAHTTHLIAWRRDSVTFLSAHGHLDLPAALALADGDPRLINRWRYAGTGVPEPGMETLHINLYLYRGKAPRGEGELELVVSGVTVLEAEE